MKITKARLREIIMEELQKVTGTTEEPDLEEAYAGGRVGPSHRDRLKDRGVGAKAAASRKAAAEKEADEEAAKEKEEEDTPESTNESLKDLIRKELLNL